MRLQSSWNSFFSKFALSGFILRLAVVLDLRQLRVAEHAVDQLEDLLRVGLQFGRQRGERAFLLGLVIRPR